MRALTSYAVIAFGIGISSTAWPQSFPTKPVRLVVPFAPGGAADIIARAMNEPLNRALGQTVIIENKPGAGSSLALDQVAHLEWLRRLVWVLELFEELDRRERLRALAGAGGEESLA